MSFSFRNFFSTDEGDLEGTSAAFMQPDGVPGGEAGRAGGQVRSTVTGLPVQHFLVSELIAFIPPAIAAQSGIPMAREVPIPLPADGSREVKLSTLYQTCPELFAAEITPLNDSTVTLPPKLEGSVEKGFQPPAEAGGDKRGSGAFSGLEFKSSASLFGGRRVDAADEDTGLTMNSFEGEPPFGTLFSKKAGVDRKSSFPPAPGPVGKTDVPVDEPQGVWGTMFYGGGFSEKDEPGSGLSASLSPGGFQAFGAELKSFAGFGAEGAANPLLADPIADCPDPEASTGFESPLVMVPKVTGNPDPVSVAPEPGPVAAPSPLPMMGEVSFDMRDLELRAIFSTSEAFTLSAVARRVAGLPGIDGCSLSTPGKLVQVSGSEEGGIGGEAREMVATLSSLTRLTGLPEARNFTIHTDRGLVSLFLEGECCVVVRHAAPAFEPGVREKLILVARSLIHLEE